MIMAQPALRCCTWDLVLLHWRSCFMNCDCDMMTSIFGPHCGRITGIFLAFSDHFPLENQTWPIFSNGLRSFPIFALQSRQILQHLARWASLGLAELEKLLQGSSAWASRPRQCHEIQCIPMSLSLSNQGAMETHHMWVQFSKSWSFLDQTRSRSLAAWPLLVTKAVWTKRRSSILGTLQLARRNQRTLFKCFDRKAQNHLYIYILYVYIYKSILHFVYLPCIGTSSLRTFQSLKRFCGRRFVWGYGCQVMVHDVVEKPDVKAGSPGAIRVRRRYCWLRFLTLHCNELTVPYSSEETFDSQAIQSKLYMVWWCLIQIYCLLWSIQIRDMGHNGT